MQTNIKAKRRRLGRLPMQHQQFLPKHNNSTSQDIGKSIDSWYEIIELAIKEHINITRHIQTIPAISNSRIKTIQWLYDTLRRSTEIMGWTTAKTSSI